MRPPHTPTEAQNELLSRLAKTGHDLAAVGCIVSFIYVQHATDEQLDAYLAGSVPALKRGRDDLMRHWAHAQTQGLQVGKA